MTEPPPLCPVSRSGEGDAAAALSETRIAPPAPPCGTAPAPGATGCSRRPASSEGAGRRGAFRSGASAGTRAGLIAAVIATGALIAGGKRGALGVEGSRVTGRLTSATELTDVAGTGS